MSETGKPSMKTYRMDVCIMGLYKMMNANIFLNTK